LIALSDDDQLRDWVVGHRPAAAQPRSEPEDVDPQGSPGLLPGRTVGGRARRSGSFRHQFDVAEAEFWACVHDGARPDRGAPAPPTEGLPAELVYQLVSRVGLAEREVATMTKQQAAERLARFWTEGS
jgi:hypothetical protein